MIERASLNISKMAVENNFQLFLKDKPSKLKYIAVAKNKGCGIGLEYFASTALKYGASHIAVANIEELIPLLNKNLPLFILGNRHESEYEFLLKNKVAIQTNSFTQHKEISNFAYRLNIKPNLHIKIDSGLNRFGIPSRIAKSELNKFIAAKLPISGFMSHFAMSDEQDKSFAILQWQNFTTAIKDIKAYYPNAMVHACNSGGYLDLKEFHGDLCRLGILFTGNYPSKVCRRININGQGLIPAATVKSRISFIKDLQPGDMVGYGMHYTATVAHKIAIIPMGYGDGYPRFRNKGQVLINGQKAPIVGGVAMDSMMVDLSNISNFQLDQEIVLMGKQGESEITAYDLAQDMGSVAYDILTRWQTRLQINYV